MYINIKIQVIFHYNWWQKLFFSGKNYSGFNHGKNSFFSTDWQKLANPGLQCLCFPRTRDLVVIAVS